MFLKIVMCGIFFSMNKGETTIDGVWGNWTDWGECSVKCGHGLQTRSRTCTGPHFGGADCTGLHNDTRECYHGECPVDGVWGKWTDWGECSVTCGYGIQTRSRHCIGPLYGGADCTGINNDTRACIPFHCPIDGVWGNWTNWNACSVTCGHGIQTRSRECIGPLYGGADCTGMYNETKVCITYGCQDSDVNYCSSAPCKNGGSCVSLSDGYHCHCPSCIYGPTCESPSSLCENVPEYEA